MHITEIVNGENLKSLADIVIDVDTVNQPRRYEAGQVVFCKTDLVGLFFDEVQDFHEPLRLITHLSDYPITEETFQCRPPCIKKWFAQNVDYQNEDLIPVPIGLENHKGPSKGCFITEGFINNELAAVKEEGNKKRVEVIYVNFSDTHPDRGWKRSAIASHPLALFYKNRNYSDYFRDLSVSKYVASPRGNGIDCHRHWESLLAGAIPLVDPHFMFDFWNLPVIQVKDWNNIELYEPEGSLEVMEMKYWRKQIRG